jgi:Tfp pilus assembly PilM family ATPase
VAKLIALEWDRKELRVLAGSKRGSQIHVENAVAIAMPAASEEESSSSTVNATAAIGQALNKLRLAKGEAILSLGRGSVELRPLVLPKVDAADLPDMVRFQAMKQFAGLSENTPIDFVVLPENANSSDSEWTIQVAALNPSVQKDLQKQAADAGLEIQKIVLRPFAVSQLLSLVDEELRKQNLLMVDILGDEADLTIVENGCVVYIRSVKLPSTDESVVGQWLVGEMRRTLMAAAGQRNGLKVDQVVVWAQQSVADSLSDRAASQLQLPIQVIDPFSKVKVEDEAKKSLQEIGRSRFSPLLGVLVAEAANRKQDIDFLNPKRRPPKEKPIARYVLMATAAASLVLGGIYLYYSAHAKLDAEIAALTKESKDLDEIVQVAQQSTRRWKSVETFIDKEVNWLDELERISNELPPASEVIVRDANFALVNKGRGLATISANGLTKDKDTHKVIEERLRKPPYYQVEPKTSGRILQKIEGLEEYSWAFDGDITLVAKQPRTPVSPVPLEKSAEPIAKDVKATGKPAAEEPKSEKTVESQPADTKPIDSKPADSKPAQKLETENEVPAKPQGEPEKAAEDSVLTDRQKASDPNKNDVAG